MKNSCPPPLPTQPRSSGESGLPPPVSGDEVPQSTPPGVLVVPEEAE